MSAESVREFYRRQGEARERERIIKLLEQEETERLGQGGITEALTIHSVIALIKGETE